MPAETLQALRTEKDALRAKPREPETGSFSPAGKSLRTLVTPRHLPSETLCLTDSNTASPHVKTGEECALNTLQV